jgi:beta-phosphoglucomutase-like phosphatase (HAD superfamily)
MRSSDRPDGPESIKGFLWDLDGVVIDSEEGHNRLLKRLLSQRFGVFFEPEKVKPKMTGKPALACAQIMVDEYGLEITAHELHALRQEGLDRLYRDEVGFVPGFPEFYAALAEAFPAARMAVVSGMDPDYFAGIDRRLGLTERFGGKICLTKNVGREKPAPDVVLYAAASIGAHPKDCIVLEDAPLGVLAAFRAGSDVVALTRTFKEETIREHAAIGAAEEGHIRFIPDYNQGSLRIIERFVKARHGE